MTTPASSSRRIRVHAILSGIWLLVAVPFLTDVACDMFVGMALSVVWLVLAVFWLVLPSTSPGMTRRDMAWWACAANAGCLGLVLAFTDIGLITRIALCESSLIAYASEVASDGGELGHDSRRIGLFWVSGEETYQGAVLLYTSQAFLNREGIAYLPPGTSEPTQIPRRLRHLYGCWYTCVWRF